MSYEEAQFILENKKQNLLKKLKVNELEEVVVTPIGFLITMVQCLKKCLKEAKMGY